MIERISISGFKSLAKVSLELGKLNIFIGTNASGKTNFFDALRVLQGLGHGFNPDEIFNGKPKGASNEIWEGIRGGCAQAGFLSWQAHEANLRQDIRLDVKLRDLRDLDETFSYSVTISAAQCSIKAEKLCHDSTIIYDSGSYINLNDPYVPEQGSIVFAPSPPPNWGMSAYSCARLLTDVQQLEALPAILRSYSTSSKASRMGERGENFAALVKSILSDPRTASEYISWLEQLTPAEMDDVVILTGALQEALFAFKRGTEVFPAPVLSDGTLRFAAIAAAFFQPDMPEMLTIEEIENGIHPSRLRLLVELLKSQTQNNGPQTIVTTHSPLVLAWLAPEDYKTTFFCQKDESTGASTITPLSQIPHFAEIVKKQPVADLFAEGWLETAL